MDVYTSRLTQTDLNDLIIKYNIPHDFHHRIPPPGFVMSELLDDAIGIYHRMFGFFSVRIPFYTFLLTVIKHFHDHFSQLSCMKGWKSGFFFIERRSIPHYMSWRHPDLGITDPKPLTGSYSQEDVWRLSAFIVKLRDMPEGGVGLIRLPFYYTPLTATNAAILTPTLEDLVVTTMNFKVLAKAEYSKKRRVSTSEAALSQGGGSAPSIAEGPSNRDPTDDAIDRDFFLFALGPYYATYLEDGVVADSYEVSRKEWEGPHQPTLSILTSETFKDPNVYKTVVDQFPTPREMIRIESFTVFSWEDECPSLFDDVSWRGTLGSI
ncbi:hypothetical protein Tco_0670947 [Tanacetum coccineum]